jgi:hypothetical protein
MRMPLVALLSLVAAPALADKPGPKAAKEMTAAVEALNRSLGLENYPEPHCLSWHQYGHTITPDETRACAEKALPKANFPELGQSYVVAILMSDIGPQTIMAIALDAPGWAVLSCDPGKPCPPRHAGTDKMGKRVVERSERACAKATTLWLPERKGCP